jgi:hypothetical protein
LHGAVIRLRDLINPSFKTLPTRPALGVTDVRLRDQVAGALEIQAAVLGDVIDRSISESR